MGRPRKPRQLKIIQGTFRADRNPENEPEPDLIVGNIRPPSFLGKYGRDYWKRTVPKLQETGVLTVADLESLELLVQAYEEYREAHDAVYRPTLSDGSRGRRTLAEYCRGGNSQTLPELAALRAARAAFRQLAADFGLNPSARNKVSAVPKEAERDIMEELVNGD